MAVTYIETFVIDGQEFGIEDYEDGTPLKEHFFGREYISGKSPRFACWRGGGGIGHTKTLREARLLVYNYAVFDLQDKLTKLTKRVEDVTDALKNLGNDDEFRLSRFIIFFKKYE